MVDTQHLALPLLAAAQAQKHVTHNEALALLDALVHLCVIERGRTAPPGDPLDGDRYLVGADPVGAFAGHAGKVAFFDLGAWRFLTPRAGWTTFVEAEGRILVHDGASWQDLGRYAAAEEVDRLGIGTAPDALNRLAARLNAALFTAREAGEGGTGDLRFVLNKGTSPGVLSQLYQSAYEGRAETGLIGDDDFRIRVSANGAEWRDAVRIDRASGAVSFPSGVEGSGGGGNLLINADFSVNQRVFAGGALAANAYGYDRWKAGPGGCTLARADDLVTLSGSLAQVIERPRLAGEPVTLSVENPSGPLAVSVAGAAGTIPAGQGRRSVTLAVPASAGGDVTVAFSGEGVSFARPVLNRGTAPEPFLRPLPGPALAQCQRYYAKTFAPATAPSGSAGPNGSLVAYPVVANSIPGVRWQFPVPMRAAPALTFFNPVAANAQWSNGGALAAVLAGSLTADSVRVGTATTPSIAAGVAAMIHAVAEAEL